MLRDFASQKKIETQTIVNAINSLKAKGWDINPYTIADEAKVARSALYRDPELMDIINEAKGLAPAVEGGATADLLQQLQVLEARNRELEERIEQLEENNRALASSQQTAWQQGYAAGFAEGSALKTDTAPGSEPADIDMAPDTALFTDSDENLEPQADFLQEIAAVAQSVAEAEGFTEAAGFTEAEQDYVSTPDPEVAAMLDPDFVPVDTTSGAEYEDDAEAEPELEVIEPAEPIAPPPRPSYMDDAFFGSADEDEEPELYKPEEDELQPMDMPIEGLIEPPPPPKREYVSDEFLRRFGGVDADIGHELVVEQLDASDFKPDDDAYDASGFEPSETVEAAAEDAGSVADETVSRDDLADLLRNRFTKPEEPAKEDAAKPAKKFVGGNRAQQEPPPENYVIRNVPPHIRKACLVLGLRPEELTHEKVHKAWKREFANPGTHPDVGGDTEMAVYLNTAKDTLFAFLDQQAPKLGKLFGQKMQKEMQKEQESQ
jgi:hypothetical protein